MKTSVTLTFTGLFLSVAAAYWYYGSPLPKPETPAISGKGSLKLLDLDKEAITLIQIQNMETKEVVTFERLPARLAEASAARAGEWRLKYPVNYLADKMMIEGLSLALRVSTKARRLVREKGWEEYGLLKPKLKIGIEAKGLSKRKYLLLGDTSPVAALIFARWEGEEDYFLLDARFKESFDRSLYSLREKKIIRFPLADLKKIHVRPFSALARRNEAGTAGEPAENFELTQEKGAWFWTEPVVRLGKPVPKEQVYEILMVLRELYAKEFLDGEPVRETERGFSLAGPYIQVWDKHEKTSTVRFGSEAPGHDAYYGLIDGEDVVLEIARGNVQKFFELFDVKSE